jgi:peptide chain release factor 1
MDKKDLRISFTKGTGPGGQNKNKRLTACIVVHVPTGARAYADRRTQEESLREAMRDIEKKVHELKEREKAAQKKQRRDAAIKDNTIVRTYSYVRGTVKDHRTGKQATIKQVMEKGELWRLRGISDEATKE